MGKTKLWGGEGEGGRVMGRSHRKHGPAHETRKVGRAIHNSIIISWFSTISIDFAKDRMILKFFCGQ